MIDTDGVLIIFTRSPVPGKTKTRLISILGEQGAANLHTVLLKHTLKMALRSQFTNVELWCTPSTDHPFLQECSYKFAVKLCVQYGENLGHRMQHALQSSLDKYAFAVIVGSDCPLLSADILDQAYSVLQRGKDAVLGSSEDGGYYLLGARKHDPDLFNTIRWQKQNVFEQTRQRLQSMGWYWDELQSLWDVDVPDDIERLKLVMPEIFHKSGVLSA
jgi:uncharacterized protein